ncbi:MAG: helix-turn-helix transcriptional regulator [Desulfobacter sp.]|nr:MAG: helix-turn-helix transcriptional regulator [Desulfobacter sp.]
MDQNKSVYKDIAYRLRGLRDALSLSEEEMALKLDLSIELLKKYESGDVDIPVSYLFSVAKAFNLDPTVLMSGAESHLHHYSLIKKEKVMTVDRREDYDYHSLAYKFSGRKMEPFWVTVPPKDEDQMTFNEHPGQEFIHMLEGRLEVVLGNDKITMDPGDNLYFSSHIPHAMRGLDGKPAKFLDVLV